MKKINSLLIILLSFVSLNTIAQVDVGCSAINTPSQGDTIYSGVPVQPNYTRENFGTALPANHPDQLYMVIEVNGDSIIAFLRNMANPMAAGASETVNGGALNFGAIQPPLTDGMHRLCIRTLIAGDNNPSNDTSCVDFYYSSTPPSADLAVTAVSVTDPVPTGIDFEIGVDQLQVVTFTLQNAGAAQVPAGVNVPVTLVVGTGNQTLNLRLNRAIAAGASVNATASRAQIANLLEFPTTAGNFDICMIAGYNGDNNASNDTTCMTYNMLPSTTPSITSFSPTTAKCKETVTITGTNFDPTPANNTVKFRGVAATVKTATATQLTVEVPETANGKITVEVTVNGVVKSGESVGIFNYDGCEQTGGVGINEIDEMFAKVFYANGSVNIAVTPGNEGLKQVQIVNVAGQIVYNEVLNLESNSVKTVDVSAIPSGMYIVNIEGNTTSIVK